MTTGRRDPSQIPERGSERYEATALFLAHS